MDSADKKQPLISVIMGVYNCEKTLYEAVECIEKQTITNWELIICDDGSEDDTYQIAIDLQKKDPERIIVLKNDINSGLNHTLNVCLDQSSGKYIARMDGDDLCEPTRFERELFVLENEPEISIVSTDMSFFDEAGIWGRIAHPTYPQNKDFIYESPFCHAACMVRREAYEAVNGYTEDRKLLRVEDYHLWIKMYAKGFKGKNIHEALYNMRDDREAYSRRKFSTRLNEAYVHLIAVKMLKLPIYTSIFALRPIIVGLLPRFIYDRVHKARLKK